MSSDASGEFTELYHIHPQISIHSACSQRKGEKRRTLQQEGKYRENEECIGRNGEIPLYVSGTVSPQISA